METAGIPCVIMGYDDQLVFFRNVCLTNGNPNVRWISVPRVGTGEERVNIFYTQVTKALTDPLTAKEKESGIYSPPAPARVMFEGTNDEAQDFLQQTTLIANCRMCPIAKYTDGLPVIVPTEEKVTAMLTGTTHKPTEAISNPLARSANALAGSLITFSQSYNTTVEKVAVAAVMAGCKAQFLPVVLAIATSGGSITSCPGTSGPAGVGTFVVSGPMAKEIGMDSGQNALDVGNAANMTLGRVAALISITAGSCTTGSVRTDAGNPVHSICFAEDLDGLPSGWIGYNQESTYYDPATKANVNYTAKDSVLGKLTVKWSIVGMLHSPGSTRQVMAGVGEGGMARYIQRYRGIAEGTPGLLNVLDGFTPILSQFDNPGGKTLIMHPNIALSLQQYGFKTKADVYKYLYDGFFMTVDDYYHMGWYDFFTDSGKNTEATSGKTYIQLLATDPGYKLHSFGNDPNGNCAIVSIGFNDEICYYMSGGRPSAYPIDPWK
jgi:hypothetical protein